MKLNLLFIVMELLTLLAYPIVFVHGKLHPSAKAKKVLLWPIQELPVQLHQVNDPLENWDLRKRGKNAYSKD